MYLFELIFIISIQSEQNLFAKIRAILVLH
jgi:hypothetical protein